MENLLKLEILEYSYDLHTIFMEYKDKMNLDINNTDLKENFLSFLEEIIQDGAIKLAKWTAYPDFPEILKLSPTEQVSLIREDWPSYYDSDIPELDIDGLWWIARCPVNLAEPPNLEIYFLNNV